MGLVSVLGQNPEMSSKEKKLEKNFQYTLIECCPLKYIALKNIFSTREVRKRCHINVSVQIHITWQSVQFSQPNLTTWEPYFGLLIIITLKIALDFMSSAICNHRLLDLSFLFLERIHCCRITLQDEHQVLSRNPGSSLYKGFFKCASKIWPSNCQ